MALKVTKGVNAVIAHWTALAGGMAGEAVSFVGKKSVQVLGAIGTSTVAIQGSNNGVDWVDLHDQAVPANELDFTAPGLKGILESTVFVRPNVTAGTGADIEVILLIE